MSMEEKKKEHRKKGNKQNKQETNQQDGNRKIIPIRFPNDSSDDPEIDDFILQSLQEEADEIERRMNADPDFADASEPENASAETAKAEEEYEKIVARLKEMGEWQEEEDGGAGEMDIRAEETDTDSAPDKEDVYRMLSEDDRRALELGRREQLRQEKKKARSARLWRVTKRGGVVAAAFVLLFAVSMNVDASRRVILRMWDTVTDALAVRTATDNLEDSVESTVAESLAAMEEIEEATGISGLNFMYWPAGMKYLQYEIQDGNTEAFVFYSYGETIFQLYMLNADEDSTKSFVTDQDTVFVETLKNWKGVEMSIWAVNPNEEKEQYQVEFEYEAFRYVLYGYISIDELEEMVNGIDFLS